MDDNSEVKKYKGTKKYVIKRELMLYKHLIGLKHIHLEQMLLKYVEVKC